MNKKYLIRATFHHYAGTITNSANPAYFGRHFIEHGLDDAAPLIAFDSKDTAHAAVKAFDDDEYLMGNGEHSRPTLVVVPVSRAPEHIRDRTQ